LHGYLLTVTANIFKIGYAKLILTNAFDIILLYLMKWKTVRNIFKKVSYSCPTQRTAIYMVENINGNCQKKSAMSIHAKVVPFAFNRW